jgi:CHAT domain-containing protein
VFALRRCPVDACTAILLITVVAACVGGEPPSDDLLRAGDYDRAEAVASRRVAWTTRRGGITAADAADALVRARIANGKATNPATIDAAERAVAATSRGSDSRTAAARLVRLSQILVATAEFGRAVDISRRAVTLLESTSPSTLDLAEAMDQLGSALSAAGRHDEAIPILEQGLRIKEASLSPTAVSVARTLEAMGLALQRHGAYDHSGPIVRRAAAIHEAANPLHPSRITSLNLLAQQLWFEGRLIESRTTSERAVALASKVLRPNHPMLALSLRYLAATAADLGDVAEALALKRRALAIAEAEFGPEHHLTAAYLQTVAVTELHEGDFVAARARFRRALEIVERKYTTWHEYVATTLGTLARADASLGDYAAAQRELDRAVEIQTRIGGANHPYVAGVLTDLAAVYRDRGLPDRALPLLERALAMREARLGPRHRDVARTLRDMASTVVLLEQGPRAAALIERAEAIWRSLDAPDAPEYAMVLALAGSVQERLGNHARARSYFDRALQLWGKVYGTAHPQYAQTELGLGASLAGLGDGPAAFAAAVRAERATREHVRLLLQSLPERQALLYAPTRQRSLDLVLTLSRSLPDKARDAADALVHSRALVLEEITARKLAEASSVKLDPAHATLRAAQQRLANLITRGSASLEPPQYQTLLEDARREVEAAESVLATRSMQFSSRRARAQIGLSEVMGALPPDAALISFVRVEGAKRGYASTVRGRGDPEPVYLAFVLRHGAAPLVETLGAAARIDRLVSQWRTEMVQEATEPRGATRSSRRTGEALRRLVWDRLVAHVPDVARVFIVPDGAVTRLPFSALPTGTDSYEVETGPSVHYLAAERDLAAGAGTPLNHGLLAIGGPAFGEAVPAAIGADESVSADALRAAGCRGLQSVTFRPLKETAFEAHDVASLWATRAGADAGATRVLTGADASEAIVKQEASRYRVLHIATHGFFFDGSCPEDIRSTRGVGGLVVATPSTDLSLLSGLALAGANLRARAGANQDDGILIAEEVAALDLKGVEWVVLSACDTGVGTITTGEGVFGLRRAFQVAGARTVIMSLWSVEDSSTRQWMQALYANRFRERLDTAMAVREASLAVLRERRKNLQSTAPFYWAAFVAAGDWR